MLPALAASEEEFLYKIFKELQKYALQRLSGGSLKIILKYRILMVFD
jgi:hypothetical protein